MTSVGQVVDGRGGQHDHGRRRGCLLGGGEDRLGPDDDGCRVDDLDPGLRGVVGLEHAGGAGSSRLGHGVVGDRDAGLAAQHVGEPLQAHPAEAQHDRLVEGAVDDGGLHPDVARAPVQHEVDVVAQVGADVVGRRRAHPTEAVGGRRRHTDGSVGPPCGEGPQQGPGDRVVGHAEADRGTPPGDGIGHGGCPFEQQRQRSGPERVGQEAGGGRDVDGPLIDRRRIGDVDDQRVIGRSALHREHPPDGLGIGGIGAEPVDRLGRERHESAACQHVRRPLDLGLVRRADHRHPGDAATPTPPRRMPPPSARTATWGCRARRRAR